MNQADKWFLTVAVAVSIAAGFGFGATYGKIGAVCGIIGSFAAVFVVFTVLRLLKPKAPRHTGGKDHLELGTDQPRDQNKSEPKAV